MNQQLRHLIPMALLALFCGLLQLPAQTSYSAGASGSQNSAVLVELFTSEGCSSCPPADTLLRQINGTRTVAGQFIVGISEHVTYWNRLGWTDPFSSETYTERQNGYAKRFHLDDIYTPQMVIDGRQQIVGSNRPELAAALNGKTHKKPVTLKVTFVEQAEDVMTLAFNVDTNRDGGPFGIFLVLTDDKDRSQVLRGENAARTLEHVAVARSLQRVATMSGSGQRTIQVKLPNTLTQNSETAHHLILFAQSPDFGEILGATVYPWRGDQGTL